MTAQILLKARPTRAQLADRLRDPAPDGLELYLDTADLADDAAMDGVVANLDACGLPSDFVLLVEGPIRSLDGEFFDLTRDSEADRELSRRLVALAKRIGARGANVHAIAPDASPASLTLENRTVLLERALGPTRFFADLALAADIVPTLENMPPILRMRESGYFYSAIGMPAQDLAWLANATSGVKVILDTSHAQLYLNVRRGVDEVVPGQNLEPLRRFCREAPGVDTIDEYVEVLGETLVASHVANAGGLLGEGLPYREGDIDLDQLIPNLAGRTQYLVTETLEPDNNCADLMRDARRRALAALGR
jgi:sugar phosphate isomerase/epimerase